MTIYVSFSGGHPHNIDMDVAAVGEPPALASGDEADAWAAAASDPLWVADRDAMLAEAAVADSEVLDDPFQSPDQS